MFKHRPIIGITPQLDINSPFRSVRLFPQYQRSIEKAGGIGIMIPLTQDKEVMEQIIDMCDGFLFTGGQDLNPSLYGETENIDLTHPTGYAPERDAFESQFYPLVKKSKKPVLAICRGFQIINVLHGGTIIQELPENGDNMNFVFHPAWNEEDPGHDIFINSHTQLAEIMKAKKIYVNSFHHQGIKDLGNGLTVSGRSRDGLVEAFDIDDLPFGVGVQWHPEVLYDNDFDDGNLFKALIEACQSQDQKENNRVPA